MLKPSRREGRRKGAGKQARREAGKGSRERTFSEKKESCAAIASSMKMIFLLLLRPLFPHFLLSFASSVFQSSPALSLEGREENNTRKRERGRSRLGREEGRKGGNRTDGKIKL